MNYRQSLEYIHSLLRFGTRPGLERVSALLAELGNPQSSLRFVHVAGTNGKGSFCTMLSEILKSAGYKTGLFTSPYVLDFCERMQINGEMISHDALASITNRIRPCAERLAERDLQPTEFEVITAAAMLYFAENGCDIVVLEAGLGGRLDSTNIIETPELSVIMSVSLDHMDVLGDTVEKIAAEKCGIIKHGGRTVCYCAQDEKAERVISAAAQRAENLYIKSHCGEAEIIDDAFTGLTAEYKSLRFTLSLPGAHQVNNAQTVIDAALSLRKCGYKISDESIIKGLENAHIPARTELIGKDPVTVLDGAHNREGITALCENLKKYPRCGKLHIIMGMMEDKEYAFAVEKIAPLADTFTCVLPSNPRAVNPRKLALLAAEYCRNCSVCPEPEKAYENVYSSADKDDVIAVCGSLYLAGDVREKILKHSGGTI